MKIPENVEITSSGVKFVVAKSVDGELTDYGMPTRGYLLKLWREFMADALRGNIDREWGW